MEHKVHVGVLSYSQSPTVNSMVLMPSILAALFLSPRVICLYFSGTFVEHDEIFSDVAHVPVSPTIDNLFAGASVAGDVRLIVSDNIFCSLLYVLLCGNIRWDGELKIS